MQKGLEPRNAQPVLLVPDPSPCTAARSERFQAQTGKILVPLLGFLTVLAIGAAAVAVVLQMQERDKRLAKERELRLAIAENDDLKARVEETQKAKLRSEEELIRVRGEFAQIQEELKKAAEAQETLSRSVEDREEEIARLTKELEQARSESKQSSSELSQLQAEREASAKRLADLERAKSDLENKIIELSGQPTVELEKVRVANDSGGGLASLKPAGSASAGLSNGQVVVVNREYDFIVMNLGKNQGLSVGQEFQIVRGDQVLGKVKVEKVYDELSAAAILPESQKNSIREGDIVKAL